MASGSRGRSSGQQKRLVFHNSQSKQYKSTLNQPSAKLLIVDIEHEGQRLDNFLLTKVKGVPRSLLYRLMRQGKIRVNGRAATNTLRLSAQDQIRLPAQLRYSATTQSLFDISSASSGPSYPSGPLHQHNVTALQKLLLANIISEQDYWIVLNKPSGLAAHGGSGIHFGVIELMRMIKPTWRKLELVHRLDRDSSGCLLLAKKRWVIQMFQQAQIQQRVTKQYLLLVKGQFPIEGYQVDLPLRKNQLKSGERMVVVDRQHGKIACTQFYLVEQFADCALVGAILQTGRTHQIRVHAASIGFPLAGDEKYGDRSFNVALRQLGLKRLFLHAQNLTVHWLNKDARTDKNSSKPANVNNDNNNGNFHSLKALTARAPLDHQLRRVLTVLRQQSPRST